MLTIEEVQGILINPKYNTGKTHFISDCVYCGKEKHLYVCIEKGKLGHHQCKKCGEAGKIKRLLRFLHRTDLLEEFDFDFHRIDLVKTRNDAQFELYNPTIALPNHTQRIYGDNYLNERGFIVSDYERYPVYAVYGEEIVLFPIYENGEIKAYSKRSTLSNAIIKKRNMRRWVHSRGADLSKMLYGIDDINGAKTAVLVEGILDKISLDRKLELFKSKICVLCMFGKNISVPQLIKLNNAGIETVLLMFDRDAVMSSKKLAFKAQDYIETVFVAPLGSKDPDTASAKELKETLYNCKTPLEFYSQYI